MAVVVMVAVEIAAVTVAAVAVATVEEVLSAAVDVAVVIQVAADVAVVILVEMVAVAALSQTIDLLATVLSLTTDLLEIVLSRTTDLLAIDLLTIPTDLQQTDLLLIATDLKDLLVNVLLTEVDLLVIDLSTATELQVATDLSVVIVIEAILDHSETIAATVALKEKYVKKLKHVKVQLLAIAVTATVETAQLLGETITVVLNLLQVHLATEVVTVDKRRKLQVLVTSAETLRLKHAKTLQVTKINSKLQSKRLQHKTKKVRENAPFLFYSDSQITP